MNFIVSAVKCKMQNAKCKIKTNFTRQCVLGGGTKTHAGAIEWIKRTELKI